MKSRFFKYLEDDIGKISDLTYYKMKKDIIDKQKISYNYITSKEIPNLFDSIIKAMDPKTNNFLNLTYNEFYNAIQSESANHDFYKNDYFYKNECWTESPCVL